MGVKRSILLYIGIFIAGFVCALLLFWPPGESGGHRNHDGAVESGPAGATEWTCSMHPQIRMPGPGKCPLCGMDLIPVKVDSEKELGPRALKISLAARTLAEIQTTAAVRRFVPIEVRMTGKIAYDETRLAYVTARMPGRADRLYVNYTGIPVKKGDHMIHFYSPALLTAQEELLQSLKAALSGGTGTLKQQADSTLEAARNKLRLWDITEEQIREIEQRGTAEDHMTIYAPLGGIVIKKHVEEGAYVNTGTMIYTIVDLSRLWVFLDAYESSLQWLKYGQKTEFTSEAYPGRIFHGRISFIDPVLDGRTRTVRVRVTVDNSEGLLKPEMFVRAMVKVTVTSKGAIIERDLAGKWISPMHPEVVKDGPGSCDVCGMPLVSAEALGYVDEGGDRMPPLIIPASAPLITGKRAVVYVRVDHDSDIFEGREIVLGPRAGDFYVVESGLSEGDLVVTNGNFKIDSALQIQARPSMMSPEGGKQTSGRQHGGDSVQEAMKSSLSANEKAEVPHAFLRELEPVFAAYFRLQEALAADDFKTGNKAAGEIHSALMKVNAGGLEEKALRSWQKISGDLTKTAGDLHGAGTLDTLRERFSLLSEGLINVTRFFGNGGSGEVTRFTCPMAFDGRGATWLQDSRELRNPYFGAVMPGCGEQAEVFVPVVQSDEKPGKEGREHHEH